MIRLLLGGSPCTKFSIAQKNDRETQPNSGIGWELFKNYLIAKEKFKPDYFLYENNVSAAQPIKDEIKKQLNVWDGTFLMPYTDVRYIEINSALVSAQNRERFYVHNCGEVDLPKDRGILLRDVLESGYDLTGNDKSFTVMASYNGAVPWNTIERSQRNMVAEPIGVGYRNRREADGKLYRRFETSNEPKANALTTVQTDSMVAVPVCVNSKIEGKQPSLADRIYDINGKATAVTTAFHPSIAEPINDIRGKSRTLTANYWKCSERDAVVDCAGGRTMVVANYNYATEFDGDGKPAKAYCYADGKIHTVYEVKDGKITIKCKEYPIKLPDGFYIIRKLTVTECRRLQQISDWYKFESREIYYQQCYSTRGKKENEGQCKYVKSKAVINPSQAKKLDCAINTILDSLDTELLNLLGNLSIKAKSVLSRDATEDNKQIWVTASNTIKSGNEVNQSTQTKNVSCVVNLLDTQGAMECVLNITVNGDFMETHYIGKNDCANLTEIPATDIIKHQTEDGFIKWLQKKYSDANSKTEKSYTISILTNWIIAKAIFMCAKATKNTWLYIDSWSELQQNSLNLELSSLRMESTKKISDTSAYRMLGNGWSIEVIKHILSHIPEIAKGEPIEVLSMYDGMSGGRIALKELGANVVRYYATEIDKYAIQTAQANFPDTIQLGDAFQVRNEDWRI